MKKLVSLFLTASLLLTLAGCAKPSARQDNETSAVKVYGDGSPSDPLEENADIVVMVSNHSGTRRVEMSGTLNDVPIFSGKYEAEKIIKQAGGYTTETPVSYYYILTRDSEYRFLVEAGGVFCAKTVYPEEDERLWILFAYGTDEAGKEQITVTSSSSSIGFA